MGTFAENIFSLHCKENVEKGDIIESEVDYVMVNDVTGLPTFEAFEKLGVQPIKEKIILIPDHYVPAKDVASAEQAKKMKEFARKYDIKNYFEVGRSGVCHQLMVEEGFVAPGRLIVGADSHTCTYGALGAFGTGIGSTEAATVFATGKLWFKVPETIKINMQGKMKDHVYSKDLILNIIKEIGVAGATYKSVEFCGETVKELSISDRFTISNMAIEMGAKAGIFLPDKKTDEYLKNRVKRDYKKVFPTDPVYENILNINVLEIEPSVACPHLPSNVKAARDLDIEIDQVYIGSCTNGRIEDLRIAANILNGKKVHKNVRCIIVPASQSIYKQAMKEGLFDIFLNAGAFISGPTCGACLGGYMGVLAAGEKAIATTNRNFVGRMGHKDSEVYLASPSIAATSAITGKITDPRDLN